MTEHQKRLNQLETQAKGRAAFRATLMDGKKRFIAPGLSMQISYPSRTSIQVLLHQKRGQLKGTDVTSVKKRIEANGWTLSSTYEGTSFWEGTFV